MGLPLMEAFRQHRGRVAPLMRRDIDTDQIVPKQFLKRLEKTGFGEFLFYDWRTGADGTTNTAFALNQPKYRGATILVTGPNFGCGSSREHAAWSLADYGFKAVIAPSFADIFRANAIANGLLPLPLPESTVETIASRAAQIDGYTLAIDLQRGNVSDDHGLDESFEFEAGARQRLLEGLDDIALILQYEQDIASYENSRNIRLARSR
jgi:3-isopropylmalate/(R)-2-methylmalate dehydratase small subunit